MTIQNWKKISETILLIILLSVSIYTIGQSFRSHLKFINYPYQVEYREGAALAVTGLYIKGENPYDIKFQPEHTYNYGFLYPLTTSMFAAYAGNNLAVHRAVTYGFILLTCIVLFFTLRRSGVNVILSFTASAILHQTLLYYGLSSIARPEGLGILLYVMGIILPWRFNFSFASCIASIILGILGYLAKPYYAFVIPVIFLYMFLFVNKKRAIIYGLISAVLFAVMVILVNAKYETFFNNTFFVHTNYSDYNFKYMLSQLILYCRVNAVILCIAIFSASISAVVFLKSHTDFNSLLRRWREKLGQVNFITLDAPVFKVNRDLLFIFVFITSAAAFVVYLGGNTGSDNAAYLFHLSSPFLILATLKSAEKIRSFSFSIVLVLLLIIALLTQFKPKMSGYVKQMSNNKRAEELIAGKKNILNSAETVSIIIDHNMKLYNSGHTEYFQYGISKLSINLGMSGKTENKNLEYRNNLNTQIGSKAFDLILISETVTSFIQFIDKSTLAKNYQCADTLTGPLSRIEIWLPLNQ